MTRRDFLQLCAMGGAASLAAPRLLRSQPVRRRELRITRILVQPARGRRLTPVAPNAYAAYRGYDRTEAVLRIQTEQGLEGITRSPVPTALLPGLIGRDPFALFAWAAGDRIAHRAEPEAARLEQLGGVDIALLDLIGKALQRPIAELLGPAVREHVPLYNSCVYMEDLLTPEQCLNLAYWDGPPPRDPVERVARKAAWVLRLPEGFRALKIKIGRSKWMGSAAAADARDIEVTQAVRAAIGPDATLYADGNKDYAPRPRRAAAYAAAVRDANVVFLEQMFPDTEVSDLRELRLALRASRNPVRLAGGESEVGGLPDLTYKTRVTVDGHAEPLVDIDQGDMGRNGFLHIREKAARQRALGMTFAPHNFGSKLGFYAQLHLGLVVPNWEGSEVDDVNFPALRADGFMLRNGVARLTGKPGLGVELDDAALGAPTFDLSG